MNSLKPFAFIILIMSITCCTNTKQCPECFTPPESLVLKIQDKLTGEDLLFNNTIAVDSIKFFYSTNNGDVIIEHEAYIDSTNKVTRLTCYEISWKSAEGIKDFSLYLNQNRVEKIYLDVQEKNDACCTFFQWVDFKINDSALKLDSTDYTYIYEIDASEITYE